MNVKTLLSKIVKCRKTHRCVWCGEKIKPGETVFFWKYVVDGKIENDYYHSDCYAAIAEWDDENDDGFEPYTFKRGTSELNEK